MIYKEASEKLERFINRIILHEEERGSILSILFESDDGNIPIRALHTSIMEYRKKYSVYKPFTDDEREMLDSIFQYWG